MSTVSTSLLVIGAGPAGITVGIAARKAGRPCILLDRRTVVSALERYPLNMTFFSTPEKLEIGGIPFIASHEKPTRRDGLLYYRRVVEHFELDARPGEEVTAVSRTKDGKFLAEGRGRHGDMSYLADAIVFATGYYDWPNLLGVPGEELPHVSHYFLEGHRHWHQDVVVVGAGNSAVDAALECWRAGARVALVHVATGFDRTVKPWVLPDITNRVQEGSIVAYWESRVVAIRPDLVEVEHLPSGRKSLLPCDQVLAMTGYYASMDLISSLRVPVDPKTGVPEHDPATMMTPVPGCYVAGVMAAGRDANRLFIKNTRGHGELIVAAIRKGSPPPVP